ncbi:MAG: DUF4394 domain-containing protein [Planctomycetes bacterium]|nr:DUF4394 domain-containing protein [Planctomycetota bacterium]
MRGSTWIASLAAAVALAASDAVAPGAADLGRTYEFVAVTASTWWPDERIELVHFTSAAPGVITHRATISGEGEGKRGIWALAVRPGTRELYALGYSWRLLKLDEWTGAVTWAGPKLEVPGAPGESGSAADYYHYTTSLQMDFDPANGELRVAVGSRQTFRVDPNTGLVIAGGSATDGDQSSSDVIPFVGGPYGRDFGMLGFAYDASAVGTPAYTFEHGQLVRIDGLGRGGAPQARVGGTDRVWNFSSVGEDVLEIAPDGAAFAVRGGTHVWTSCLQRVDLATGAPSQSWDRGQVSNWEDIGGGLLICGFCVSPSMQFADPPRPEDDPAESPVAIGDPPRIDVIVVRENLGRPGADAVTIRGGVDVGGVALEAARVTISVGSAAHDFTLDGTNVGRDGGAFVRFGEPHGNVVRFRVLMSPEDLAAAVQSAMGDNGVPLPVVLTVAGVEHRVAVPLKVAQRGRHHRIARGRKR